uniref:Uncharacterized protein LOC116956903 n=1 Tax=Petromyzon marinus TaxID=7757 RepID=A0AAJ7XIM5_PETMA|nr:uncharacterized protein LOC116956903 [Petromyzon marinus]
MASHPRNSIPACLLLTLFLTIQLTQAETFQRTDATNDEEVKRKCGFSLKAIHDCKYQKCQEASAFCAVITPAAEAGDLTDCQIKHCMQEKKKCEEPLNKFLSKEEKCEGNRFNDVEMGCLLKLRTSLEQLTVCKRDGYLEEKVYCFKNEWKRRIGAYATDELRKTATPEAIDCAYNTCFQNVTRCLYDHHHDMAINPASVRRFDLAHCAYVAINYAHECESIPRLSGCAERLATCISEHPELPGITEVVIGGAFGGLAIIVAIVLVVKRKDIAAKLRNCRGGSTVGQGSSTVGQGSSTVGQGSSTVGQGSSTVGQGSSTVGQGSSTGGQGSSTVGQGSSTVGQGSSTVGQGSSTGGQGSSTVGQGSCTVDVQDFDAQDPTATELVDEDSKLLNKGQETA